MNLQYENASKLFLRRLKGVTDRNANAKSLAGRFIEVFRGGNQTRGKANFLASGNALSRRDRVGADRRQSGRDDQKPSQRRWAPRKMRFKLVEPLKCLFKDEVRELGLDLACRENCATPAFPARLAVRILGEVNTQRPADTPKC